MTNLRTCFALSAALLSLAPARADPAPSPGRVAGSEKVALPSGLIVGRTSEDKFVSTPDSLEVSNGITCTSAPCLLTGATGINVKGSGGTTLFVRASADLPNGTMLYSATDDYNRPRNLEIVADRLLMKADSGISVRPHPGITGLSIQPDAELTSTTPGQFNFNQIFSTVNAEITGPGDPGMPGCACITNIQSTLFVGSKFKGVEAYGGSFGLVVAGHTQTNSDYVGLASGVLQNYIGTSRLYGGNTGVTLGPKGTSPFVIGHETDVTVNNPASTPYRSGYNVVNTGSHRATVVDGAFTVGCGVAGGCFKHLLALYTADAPGVPNTVPIQNALASDGDIVWSERAQTLAHILNLPNVTVTGTILNFPGVVLTGGGKLTTSGVALYAPPPPVPAGQVSYGGTTAPASKCGSLPGAAGCVVINVGGTQRYVPFY